MRDGTQVLVELVFCHTDTVVAHRNGPGFLVKSQPYGQGIRYVDVFVDKTFKREFVEGIGSIGDKFTQEDLAIGVDRVDHEVKQLFALSLELLHS